MTYWTASALPKPTSRKGAAVGVTEAGPRATAFAKVVGAGAALTIILAFACSSPTFAQQPMTPPAPLAAPAQPEPAAKPKSKKPPKHAPEAQQAVPPANQSPAQAAPPQQAQPGQTAQQGVQLIFSPWTKFCLKGQPGQPPDPNAKQVCFTGKDARVESGQPVAAAVLIEPEGQERKLLRITLPLGMQIVHGTRIIIDQNQPMTAPYVVCFTNGCMADYEANADMIGKLKKGQGLALQAINATGQPITVVMPLNDFAKAYEGPPTDPKVFEEQQRKLQEELQRRADEARKKLESQQGGPTSQATPPSAAPAGKTQ
jgi:invasion protein IalB